MSRKVLVRWRLSGGQMYPDSTGPWLRYDDATDRIAELTEFVERLADIGPYPERITDVDTLCGLGDLLVDELADDARALLAALPTQASDSPEKP